MSYTQFGYSTYAASTPLLTVGGGSSQPACYERTGVSPESQYDGRLYPRLPYAAAPYPPADAPDPAAATPFYAPAALNSTYSMKEGSDPWRSISQSASYYYDPTLAAYGYGGLDFNGARRKNVTRDSTSTLKAWLNEHRKNPYPTKGEKIMLAIITKMTLTQVSTWFANARRRLKKENKMTWEPRNKAEAHDEDAKRGDDGAKDEDDDSAPYRDDEKPLRNSIHPTELDLGSHHQRSDSASFRPSLDHAHPNHAHHPPPPPQLQPPYDDSHHQAELLSLEASHSSSPDLDPAYIMRGGGAKDPFDPYKPKIWSLADTATANKQQLLLGHAHPADLGAWSATPTRSYGGCGFGPISSLQTDTPPQTPPNMKVGGTHHHAAVVPSAYLESHRAAYMGQATSMCQSDSTLGESQMQDDKLESYSSAHGSQSSTSNQNAANECISEDYDYSASSVR